MKKLKNPVTAMNKTETTFRVLPASERELSAVATDASVAPEQNIDHLVNIGVIDSHAAVALLEQLESERQSWEGKELIASHARLYSILTDCYRYYLAMKDVDSPKQLRVDMAKGLARFISMRKLRTLAGTHDMNKVVKAVFGEDRRRVSAYSMVLRIALTAGPGEQPLASAELAAWITAKGGIEEIRQGSKSGGMTTTERAEAAATALNNKPLMTFKPDAKAMAFGTEDADKMMVLVVTYRPTGDIEVNSVIKNGAVVRSALAAHYAANKEQMAATQTCTELAQPTAIAMALNKINN